MTLRFRVPQAAHEVSKNTVNWLQYVGTQLGSKRTTLIERVERRMEGMKGP